MKNISLICCYIGNNGRPIGIHSDLKTRAGYINRAVKYPETVHSIELYRTDSHYKVYGMLPSEVIYINLK